MVLKIDLLKFPVSTLLKLPNLIYVIGCVKIYLKALCLSFVRTALCSNLNNSGLPSKIGCYFLFIRIFFPMFFKQRFYWYRNETIFKVKYLVTQLCEKAFAVSFHSLSSLKNLKSILYSFF